MKMLKRWIRNWLNSDDQYTDIPIGRKSAKVSVNESFEDNSTVSFHITGARGGLIVTAHHYDTKTDHHYTNKHVIFNDANVTENIASIITMEMMSK